MTQTKSIRHKIKTVETKYSRSAKKNNSNIINYRINQKLFTYKKKLITAQQMRDCATWPTKLHRKKRIKNKNER